MVLFSLTSFPLFVELPLSFALLGRVFLASLLLSGVVACGSSNLYDEEVWQTYDWVPDDAEYYRPPSYPGYTGPVYDNDSTYIPPYDFGSCSGSLGCE